VSSLSDHQPYGRFQNELCFPVLEGRTDEKQHGRCQITGPEPCRARLRPDQSGRRSGEDRGPPWQATAEALPLVLHGFTWLPDKAPTLNLLSSDQYNGQPAVPTHALHLSLPRLRGELPTLHRTARNRIVRPTETSDHSNAESPGRGCVASGQRGANTADEGSAAAIRGWRPRAPQRDRWARFFCTAAPASVPP